MTSTLPPSLVRCYGCGSKYDALDQPAAAPHYRHIGNSKAAFVGGQWRGWRHRRRTNLAHNLNRYELALLSWLTTCQQERDAAIRDAHAAADELARRDHRLTRLIARR